MYVDEDTDRAIKLYSSTCESRQGIGCQAMGRLYDEGSVVKQDFEKARNYYLKGCEDLYDGSSCGALGAKYYQGDGGVIKNSKEALFYLEKGCTLGHDKSCSYLGDFYAKGIIVKNDDVAALKLYEKACRIDDIEACYKAGMLIVEDRIPQADYLQAWDNLKVACRADMEIACDASKPIVYQARFEGIVKNALESNKCEIWTRYKNTQKESKTVVKINKDTISVLEGDRKGTWKIVSEGLEYKTEPTRKVASSSWTLSKEEGDDVLALEHHENWLFQRFPDPILSFPPVESFSREQDKNRSLFFSRENESIKRESDSECSFVQRAQELGSEHCTEVQALLGAQLISSCRK